MLSIRAVATERVSVERYCGNCFRSRQLPNRRHTSPKLDMSKYAVGLVNLILQDT